ncbi:MAG: hypothetical protein LBV68_08375 [Spirochaetaceae bacterium]|jgi:hypothetical protein|nr:hypothetical protein [Spirochaetaceae bacterium]
MKPILVVLAAGMGSRYGGLKQIDRLGANGEVLLDYSVFDALRSGFGKIIFIIRRDIEADFTDVVLSRLKNKVEYELAYQELDSLIPSELVNPQRTKPWGTTHALLCAQECIDASFAIINSDDFYGREAFAAMGAFLNQSDVHDGALVPYRLEKTLSLKGTVTRGVCEIQNGFLTGVDELMKIENTSGGVINTAPDGVVQKLGADMPVSMNFWGFPATIFSALKKYFAEFLALEGRELKSECYLPRAADWFIKNKTLKICALDAVSEWFGITYQEDKEAAIKRIQQLTASGVYPESLWGKA